MNGIIFIFLSFFPDKIYIFPRKAAHMHTHIHKYTKYTHTLSLTLIYSQTNRWS